MIVAVLLGGCGSGSDAASTHGGAAASPDRHNGGSAAGLPAHEQEQSPHSTSPADSAQAASGAQAKPAAASSGAGAERRRVAAGHRPQSAKGVVDALTRDLQGLRRPSSGSGRAARRLQGLLAEVRKSGARIIDHTRGSGGGAGAARGGAIDHLQQVLEQVAR